MGLKAHPVPGKAKSKMLCEAFIKGARASMAPSEWNDLRGNVFYGVKGGNFDAWQKALNQAQNHGVPFYTIDNSYFDPTRGIYFRVTRNGLQHPGMGETDGTRFQVAGVPIKPWRKWDDGGHVLVVEQSEDHMVRMVGEPTWLRVNIKRFIERGINGFKIRKWSPDKTEIQKTLAEDLVGARIVLTHTSAAAVMAVLAGVPACCSPKCAAFGTSYFPDENRRRWAGVLADNQFTMTELEDGTAWRKVTSR